jgi:hypothetical protein
MLNLTGDAIGQGLDQVLIYSINMSSLPVANFRNCVFSRYVDSVDSSFSSTKVFGRTDPIYTFEGNARKVSTSFTTTDTLQRNKLFLDSVMHAMYPSYDRRRNYVSPPIFVIKFGGMNSQFLMGFFNGLKYEVSNPSVYTNLNDLDTFFDVVGDTGKALGYLSNSTQLGPSTLTIELDFTVINRREIGVRYDKGYIFGDVLGAFYPNLLNDGTERE